MALDLLYNKKKKKKEKKKEKINCNLIYGEHQQL